MAETQKQDDPLKAMAETQKQDEDPTKAMAKTQKQDEDHTKDSTKFTKRLNDLGLNPQKWIPLFRKHLGLESLRSLDHMGPEDYQKVEKYAEFPWEKEAIRKLLKIHHAPATLKEIQDEQAKKSTDQEIKGKTRLDEVKKLKLEAKENLRKTVQVEAGALKRAKDMSAGSSRPLVDSLGAKIDKNDQGLTIKEKRPLSEGLCDEDFLLQASGGLALEGIYVTRNPEDVLQKREHLLTVPSGFSLSSPQQKPVLEQKEFSSSKEETTFYKSMEKLGFSMTTSAKGGIWVFQAEGSVGRSSTSKSKQQHETHNEHAYISKTKYSYIPLASCYFTKDQLRLSPAALEELRSTEDVLEICSEAARPDILREKYEHFFIRFGSHANQGPLHFGGIFWWTATSKGFKQEMLEKVKKEIQEVLDVSVSVSVCSRNASADVTKTDTKRSCKKDDKKEVKKDVQLTVTKTGGPATVDTLNEWKAGLEAGRKTWSVIDRGFYHTPVWEILLYKHKEHFRDVYQVAKDLKNVYAAVTSHHVSLPLAENVSTAAHDANLLLSKIPSWAVEPAQQQLQELVDFRQHLNDKTGNYNVWFNICLPHEALQRFLQKVMDSYKLSTKADEPVIRSLLKCLLQNLESASKIASYDSYSAIIRWLHPEKEEKPTYNISDFPTFLDFVSKAKNNLPQPSSEDDPKEEDLDAQVKINVLLNSYVGSFLTNLRNKGQKEEEMIVLCAASSVGYSAHKQYFQQRLGRHEVSLMVDEMQNLLKEYHTLKVLGVSRAQARLLEAALTGGVESRPRSTEQRKELLQLMVEHLKSCLEQEVRNILQKHKDLRDLQSLIQDLRQLRSGDYESVNVEDLAEEIKNVCHATNQTLTTEPPQTSGAENNTITCKQDVMNLMRRLGLEPHFPKGLTRRNFHLVHTSLPKCPDGESDLPLHFMQMLMKLDYRFRYLSYKGSNKTNDDASSPEVDKFDSIDD